jgi:MFS family permease
MSPSSGVARARNVLSVPDFRALFVARVVSQFGDGLFQAVLVASVVFSPTKQSTAVGFAKAVAILVVPYSVVGPFAGVFIDRWSRRRILMVTPVLRAALAMLVLAGTRVAVPFYAGALLVLSANRLFLTTAGAVTPRLVPSNDLVVANSINSASTMITLLGTVVGGLLADLIGFRPVVVVTSLMWLAVPFAIGRIRSELTPLGRQATGQLRSDLVRVAGELRDGVRRLLHSPRALAPVTSITVEQLGQGLILVVSLVVFRERFKEGVGSFSWLVAAGGAGGALGLITVTPLEARLGRRALMSWAFAVSGLPLLIAAFQIDGFTVLAASFLVGLAYPWKKVPADTMVQESIPDAYRGRVFAIYDVANNMARVLAAVAAIGLLNAFTVTTVVAGAGIIALIWVPVIRRWLRRSSTLDLRMYAGSRADETPRAVVMSGLEEPVEVERSWQEERSGSRLMCFRLRLPDGSRIEVSRADDAGRWSLDRQLPA